MSQFDIEIDYELAACQGVSDPEIFFPVKTTVIEDTTVLAKAICGKCPVKLDCLSHGLHHEKDGIWGGTTPNERQSLRKKLKIVFEPITYEHG